MPPLAFSVPVFQKVKLLKRSIFLLFGLTVFQVCCAISFAQPVAIGDFYVVDGTQILYTPLNDIGNTAGTQLLTPLPAAHGNAIPMPDYPIFFNFVPHGNYTGFDFFTYLYHPIGGSGSDSNIAYVGLFLIGNDDGMNAGRSRCPANSVGQPVNVTNGNMWLEQSDYSLPGRGDIIEINRFYNSMIQSSGLFGFGWSTKYDESIILYGDKGIRLSQPDGRAVFFGRLETTIPYTSYSPGVVAQITPNANGTYTLTYKDGQVRTFNSAGRLVSTADRNGNLTTLSYDTGGRLIGVTDAAGRTLTFTPNINGTIAQISDSLGTVADYEYYANTTLLKSVTKSDGSKFKFEYVNRVINGQTKTYLATVKDAVDNILETHAYDTLGRATTSEKHGGVEKYTIEYTVQASPGGVGLSTVTDALGRVTKYHYYRFFGSNIVFKTEGSCSCGGSGIETTTYEYDIANSWLNLNKKIDALGRQTTYKYDGYQNVIEETDPFGKQKWTYNSFGQVLTYKDRVDSQNLDPNVNTAVLTYNTNGNLKTYTDAVGKITTLEYPTANNVGLPDSIKDARNNVTKFKWFATSGLLDEIEDPYTKKTKFTYDARGRTKTVTNALNHLTQYNYFDDTQRKVEMIYPNLDKITYKYDIRRLLESVTDERGKITSYEFDPAYRLKKITDPLAHVKEFGYDLMSHMTSYKDPLGNDTNYVFDDFDRLKEITHPAAVAGATRLTEKFEYDKLGRIKKYTDTANRFTQYGYTDSTRTNTVTDALGKITTIKYNQRFQTFEVKDAINQVYTFGYDPLGRVLSQTRAGGTMSFEYDEVGNRKKRTDYAGRITNYTYDNLNRLKKIEYEPGSGNPVDKPQSTYNYDDISRLTSAVNDVGTVAFTYDNRNRLKTETDVFGHLIEFGYDAASNRTQLKLNGSVHAAYAYDDANRLTTLTDEASQNFTFGYDIADRMTSRTMPNGVSSTFDYDNMSRLKRLRHQSSSATLVDNQYMYNAANQISQIADLTQIKNFTFDNVDRLTGMTNGTSSESYTFDDVGNRTSSHLSSTYGYQTGKFNQLTSTASATMSYDLNGNMVRKSEGSNFWRYTWDYENRMTEASTRKQKVRHKYDALGRRVERNLGFSKERTKFTHDGLDVVMDDDNNAGITKYQNGLGIDDKLKLSNAGSSSYFLQDHLGSTVGLADSTAVINSSKAYDSFGNSTGNLASRYQYTGREFDSFTNQYYYRARFYDSNLGRFTSEDPIGFGGGDVNLYGYVHNRPTMFRDPTGEIVPVLVAGGIAVAVLILASPSYVNAPGPRSPVYYPDNPLLANAAGGAACGLLINKVVSPLITRLLSGTGDDIIQLGISQGPYNVIPPNTVRVPSFLGQQSGPSIPVPQGATQTPIVNPGGRTTGFGYNGGSGGNGLDPKVASVRVMDPTLPRGPSPGYPNGNVTYMNQSGQPVNPYSGQTVPKNSPWWHIPLDH